MSCNLPPGWIRQELPNGRSVFLSPPPRMKITSAANLRMYHSQGRFLDIKPESLNFGKKTPKLKSPGTSKEPSVISNAVCDLPRRDDFNIKTKAEIKIEKDIEKISQAVSNLTLDSNKTVDHEAELSKQARSLNDLRLKVGEPSNDIINLHNLKDAISKCSSEEEVVNTLMKNEGTKNKLTSYVNHLILEEMLNLRVAHNPLQSFPPNVNSSVYAEIVQFGLEKAPNMISFLVELVIDKNACIVPENVIQIANLFSLLAHSINRQNDTLQKVKGLALKHSGLTNDGIDYISSSGIVETSRSVRRQQDFLAGISWKLISEHLKNLPFQPTFDNMDLTINNLQHHMTLSFIEVEKDDTKHLSTEAGTLEDKINQFDVDSILIKSERNVAEFEQFNEVKTNVLGRIFAKEFSEVSWMKNVLDNHYQHPTQKSQISPSITLTKKPMYYQETDNNDIVKIVEGEQLDYLRLVAEQQVDKDAFLLDLELIMMKDAPENKRREAEERVHKAASDYGDYIGHGDLLTFLRFYIAKRLRKGSVTAFERLEYVKHFRPELFHLKMNKVMTDFKTLMKSDVNADDCLSLGWLNGYLQLPGITSNPSIIKKPGSFERHDQFLTTIGLEFLIHAFQVFLASNDSSKYDKTKSGACAIINDFLIQYEIPLFYDCEESDKQPSTEVDDLLKYFRDVCGRTTISLMMDKMEEEGDALGLRALRIIMIPYFLGKKSEKQDSKYAQNLLLDLVLERTASPRTQERMDNLVCVRPSKVPGTAIFRDKKNEHEVRKVKEQLRGLHSSLRDVNVEKKVTGLNAINLICDYDKQAMLRDSNANSSYDYMGDERRQSIREQLNLMEPLSSSREKVTFYQPSLGSPYALVTRSDLCRFVERNKKNFERHYSSVV